MRARCHPRPQPLAGPVASGVQQLATSITQEALQRPRVQALWEDANRAAHERLIALLDDEGEFVSTTGGEVTLDLSALVTEVAAAVGHQRGRCLADARPRPRRSRS